MNPMKFLGEFVCLWRKAQNRFLNMVLKPLFHSCGENVRIDGFGMYSFKTISIGRDVFIGRGANFSASNSSITIGNKVMIGPGVTIMGGDHNTSVLGSFMYDVKDKKTGDDQPVEIGDDVWIGCNATILKGVSIGRGSIVAAGALVIHAVLPYAIVGGVPARCIRYRWTVDEIMQHEKKLYSPEQRFSAEQLRAFQAVEQ